ncbi:MAG TPA: hypothetical protein VJV39_26640 [Dongiaceae bacterium]|nr:hypothetical protein [Dongiaceae bacterium]
MMRILFKHRRAALRAIGPGVLLVATACLPDAAFASEQADASQRVCDIPYICDRDTNRGGGQTATGSSTDDSRGSASSPTSDPDTSSPTGDTSSSPTGD